MESDGLSKTSGSAPAQLRGRNLTKVLSSMTVMQNAAMTLGDLGIKITPMEITSATSVSVIRDTSIIAVEITLPDQDEAKVAADVLAAEMKKVYAKMCSPRHAGGSAQPAASDGPCLVTVDPAVVFPVNQHKLSNLWLGLMGGLLLGVIVAAVIPSSKEGA
jgi:capsular polysaccharide biosynthesis protein